MKQLCMAILVILTLTVGASAAEVPRELEEALDVYKRQR